MNSDFASTENVIQEGCSWIHLKLIYDNEIVDTWIDKKWPYDILSEVEWLIKEHEKINNILKKDDLILTGAYGFPVPINDKKFIEVKSSSFGDVKATFN